jgi:hypothetical protein
VQPHPFNGGPQQPCGDSRPDCPGGPEVAGRSDPSTKRKAAVDPTQPEPPLSDRNPKVCRLPEPMLVTIELFSGVFYCMLVEASRSVGLILFI